MDSNVIIRILEDSFLRTLKAPPTITEGAMPTPMPLAPSGFLVEYNVLTLDRLGAVRFPHVVCPHSLAMIEGLHGGSRAVYRYAACLQAYRDGYRVHLVETRTTLAHNDSTPSSSASSSNLLEHLVNRMIEGLSHARLALTFHETTPVESEDTLRALSDANRSSLVPSTQAPAPGTLHSHEPELDMEAISPLVCLALDRSEVVVRSSPGEGHVIGTLRSELALGENTPLDGAYVRIRTEQGLAGWVKKSDLHWSPCPIG
jgi:hypothetical protein